MSPEEEAAITFPLPTASVATSATANNYGGSDTDPQMSSNNNNNNGNGNFLALPPPDVLLHASSPSSVASLTADEQVLASRDLVSAADAFVNDAELLLARLRHSSGKKTRKNNNNNDDDDDDDNDKNTDNVKPAAAVVATVAAVTGDDVKRVDGNGNERAKQSKRQTRRDDDDDVYDRDADALENGDRGGNDATLVDESFVDKNDERRRAIPYQQIPFSVPRRIVSLSERPLDGEAPSRDSAGAATRASCRRQLLLAIVCDVGDVRGAAQGCGGRCIGRRACAAQTTAASSDVQRVGVEALKMLHSSLHIPSPRLASRWRCRCCW